MNIKLSYFVHGDFIILYNENILRYSDKSNFMFYTNTYLMSL
jgi:hypothetical protein